MPAVLSPAVWGESVSCDERGGSYRCHPGVGLAVDDAERSRYLFRGQSAPNLEFHARKKRPRDSCLENADEASSTIRGVPDVLQLAGISISNP